MKKYRHLFFDLDHTLWDFETNSRHTLCELFDEYKLSETLNSDQQTFYETYLKINDTKWELYRQGKISKEQLRQQRFYETFMAAGLDDAGFSRSFEEAYIERCPHRTALLPGALETLGYLRNKYELHILTNGFVEVQDIKLTKSGLKPFFREIISSEAVGVNKPDIRIFEEAMKLTGAVCENSLMIGDNLEADILGARNCGIDQVYFNPLGKVHDQRVTFEVVELKEVLTFL